MPGRIHISGFTAAYLSDRDDVILESGIINSEIEEHKARPQQDYDNLLEDLRTRYEESRDNLPPQFSKEWLNDVVSGLNIINSSRLLKKPKLSLKIRRI